LVGSRPAVRDHHRSEYRCFSSPAQPSARTLVFWPRSWGSVWS
jgi:hypothetical protein